MNLLKVKLRTPSINTKRKNKALENELRDAHGTERGVLSVGVMQLHDDFRLPIAAAVSDARSAWDHRTLAYEDGGWRVVRAENFQDLIDDAEKRIANIEKAVDRLYHNYDEAKAKTKKALNGLYDDGKFIRKEAVADRFRCVIDYEEITETQFNDKFGDSASHVRSGKDRYEQGMKTALYNLVDLLKDSVADFFMRVSENKKGAHFKSMITSLQSLCERAHDLNMWADPMLDSLICSIQSNLAEWDSDVLKDDPQARQMALDDAKAILDALGKVGA